MLQGGSIRIGRIGGIAIDIHFTFALVIIWGGWQGWVLYGDLAGIFNGILTILLLFACVLLHELGHGFQARAFGLTVRGITLLPVGGVAQLDTPPTEAWHELLIALAGPVVNLGLSLVTAFLLLMLNPYALDFSAPGGWLANLFSASLASTDISGLFLYLLGVNLMLFLFNAIPAFPMDGGRVVRAGLALLLDYQTATRIASWMGQFIALGMGVLGFLGWPPAGMRPNFLLVVVAMTIYSGARQEEIHVRRRRALVRIEVGDVYHPTGVTLAPWDAITPGLIRRLSRQAQAYPVVVDERLVGMITLDDLQCHSRKSHPPTVAHLMRSDFSTLRLRDTLWVALLEMNACRLAALPVFDEGLFCGIVILEDINQAWRFSARQA